MQKLIYQNLRGERVVFALEPYVLASVRGLGMCGVDKATSRGSMQQGQTFTALRRDARTVDATISILARSRAELYALREALCGALSIDKAMDGEKRARLIYENDHGSWWTWAVPEGNVDWKGRACDAHVNIKLSFACESAFLYGIAPNAVTFQRRRSGFRLPMRMPLTLGSNRFSQTAQNRGHAYAPVTITILSDGEIPCLVNRSTGARLALVREFGLAGISIWTVNMRNRAGLAVLESDAPGGAADTRGRDGGKRVWAAGSRDIGGGLSA